nr:MAG TPA: hypothetical protein [Caudoviricetes sp.]
MLVFILIRGIHNLRFIIELSHLQGDHRYYGCFSIG